MDFAALPPEVNSARLYAGPGAAPMMAAAAAWSGLGAELSTTAASYQSVTATLVGEEWLGPASVAMAAAVAPYVAWMTTTAAAAEHAAAQATASAAAYEAAFAMTVPPPVIVANRTQLAALVATNLLGQNTPAIAATEAVYGEMWAQDAAAMYGYAAASASAAALNPLTAPTSTANPAGPAASAGLSQLVAHLPDTVQTLAAPSAGSAGLAASGLNGFWTDVINATQNIGIWNVAQTVTGAAGNIGAWNLFAGLTTAIGLAKAGPSALSGAAAAGMGAPVLVGATTPEGAAGSAAAPVAAAVGEAYTVDGLSVPTSWSAALPEDLGFEVADPTDWTDGASGGLAGMAPVGHMALGGAALSSLALQARQPAAAPSKSLLGRPRARKRRGRLTRGKSAPKPAD